MANEIITNINYVEGFNPEDYVRTITDDKGENPKKYLDVAWRKVWFYLKYPSGRIIPNITVINDKFIIMEAKVYHDINDPEDRFAAKAFAQRWFKPGDVFGERTIETAETGAIGRALANDGFGSQYCCDIELDKDGDIVDAPIQTNNTAASAPASTNGTKKKLENKSDKTNTGTGAVSKIETQSHPVTLNAPIGLLVDNTNNEKGKTAITNSGETKIPEENQSTDTNTEDTENIPAEQQETPKTETGEKPYNNSMEVSEIMKIMQVEDAVMIVVDFGFNQGKTLGELAHYTPEKLEWYYTKYTGKNNILRAGAKILSDYVEELKHKAAA